MITQDNISEVINQLSDKDKKRIKNNIDVKEYGVLELQVFNAGSITTIKLTNDCYRYRNVSDHGDCILELSDIASYLD